MQRLTRERFDRVARRPFDPADQSTWGQGGTAPLLIDPCHSGSTHALVFGGPGGFKTTSIGIPTMLTWCGAAVVLVTYGIVGLAFWPRLSVGPDGLRVHTPACRAAYGWSEVERVSARPAW